MMVGLHNGDMLLCSFLVYDKLQNERYKYFKKYGFNDAKGLTLSLTPGIFVFNGSLSLMVDKYNSIVLELSGGCGVSTDALPGASIGMFHTIALDDSNIDIGSTLLQKILMKYHHTLKICIQII